MEKFKATRSTSGTSAKPLVLVQETPIETMEEIVVNRVCGHATSESPTELNDRQEQQQPEPIELLQQNNYLEHLQKRRNRQSDITRKKKNKKRSKTFHQNDYKIKIVHPIYYRFNAKEILRESK
ncbi:unnamed protein product [Didymodactylos carnosus]|uniref:Uncharacterized protein n=1 Tax=Didymodactylos carnosus TaxID=1234261 RepID=A0A815ETG6_9BILA|nr:unnamed protein product [Didymodactylos carnosus]CAF1314254.1 unnamed protein product [Didymodactylos carnosus]CAF3680670.1 unnamed protein product [Didymodactylos carnosus]CAF4154608.1 unnamed protein product [Didymodactylos carnosus]